MEHLSIWGGGTPPQWNIYPEQGGAPPQWNIYPEGAGYTISVEYLSRAGGYTTSVEYLSRGGGVHHLSGIFIHSSGGTPPQCNIYPEQVGAPPQWNIYPEGGCTPPQWNIYPHGGGYTTSVEYLSRGGGTPPQWNINTQGGGGVHHLNGIFFPASHFPQCPIFPPFFFSFWGGCSHVLHGLPFFPTFNFHDGFFLWVAVLGKGECQTFSCLFLTGRKEGRGQVPHFYETFGECVLFYVLDTRCQIRLQTSDFIHIVGVGS